MRVALLCLLLALITACSAADDEGDVASTTAGQTAQQCACQSGQFCVDGVCCDTPCSGDCVACTAALKGSGVDGVCGPIAAGTDPESECNAQGVASCGNDGNCNGSGACASSNGQRPFGLARHRDDQVGRGGHVGDEVNRLAGPDR